MKKGFTLIELLVVIAIIGILAAMMLASISGARQRANDARRRSDLAQIKTALEMYMSDHDTYPGQSGDITDNGTILDCNFPNNRANCLEPDYMPEVPNETTAGQNPYSYTFTPGPTPSYTLCADLQRGGFVRVSPTGTDDDVPTCP